MEIKDKDWEKIQEALSEWDLLKEVIEGYFDRKWGEVTREEIEDLTQKYGTGKRLDLRFTKEQKAIMKANRKAHEEQLKALFGSDFGKRK